MKKFLLLVCVFSFFAELFSAGTCFAEGKRPYEMDWAGRFEDDVPPLADSPPGLGGCPYSFVKLLGLAFQHPQLTAQHMGPCHA